MESLNKESLIPLRDSIFDIAKEIKEYSNDLFNKLMGVHAELEELFFINNVNDDVFDWPMTIDKFCQEFDYNISTFTTHVSNLKLRDRREYWVEGPHGGATCYISKIGAIKILEKMRSEKARKYLRTYHRMNIPLKAERQYLDIIQHAVHEFDNPIKKKVVEIDNNKFEIDLYLEKIKLAVECDEQDHAYKDPIEESYRKEAIEKELGCRFLSFNPDELDFNVGEIINIILCLILGKKINAIDALEYYEKCTKKRQIRIEQKLKKQRAAKILTKIDLDEFH
jgi:hypothetical protein